MRYIEQLGSNAKSAEPMISTASTELKNKALNAIMENLLADSSKIIEANNIDIANAVKNGMSGSMQDRVADIISLNDPIGQIISGDIRPNGLRIMKSRVPLGVIGIIFESRPNVTVDAAALCLKAGNAVILKGGKEAINSNKCLCSIMREAVASVGLPADIIQLVEDTSRETAAELMKLNGYLDVLIPRGGAGLIQAVVKQATVPVIETGTGNCHVYVDSSSDLETAVDIVDNGKTSRPSVCNAVESLLVHKDCAEEFLPMIANVPQKFLEIL